jgi:hypothetical protein
LASPVYPNKTNRPGYEYHIFDFAKARTKWLENQSSNQGTTIEVMNRMGEQINLFAE